MRLNQDQSSPSKPKTKCENGFKTRSKIRPHLGSFFCKDFTSHFDLAACGAPVVTEPDSRSPIKWLPAVGCR